MNGVLANLVVNPVCLPNENVGKTGVRETKMEDKKMAVTASMVKG